MIALLLLAGATLPAPPPAAPKHFDRTTWSLLAADASVRSLDVYSTHRGIQLGYGEKVLPSIIAEHVPAMIAYSGGCVVLNGLTARWLVRHRHPHLAKIWLSVDIAQDGFDGVDNLTRPAHKNGWNRFQIK